MKSELKARVKAHRLNFYNNNPWKQVHEVKTVHTDFGVESYCIFKDGTKVNFENLEFQNLDVPEENQVFTDDYC